MQPSMFNVRVPLPARGGVFLMNTFTDAQLVVSGDVAALLDRLNEVAGAARSAGGDLTGEELGLAGELAEHGFLVESREREREALDAYFRAVRDDMGMPP